MMLRSCHLRCRGVTLIELVVVIALAGIVTALIVQFAMPVRGFIDTTRRAALADTADTALRRIGRDLHLALPNSVRVTSAGGVVYLEFALVRGGGRYRSEVDSGATNTCDTGADSTPANDVLSFGATDKCFKSLGEVTNFADIAINSDWLVVFNLPPRTSVTEPGTANANFYEFGSSTGGNKSKITSKSASGTSYLFVFDDITLTYESPGKRFFVVEGPVTYACDAGNGTLRRHWAYTIADTQPTPPSGGSNALIATGVKACEFTYNASVASQGAGLVTLRLRLETQDSRGDTESATLYHAVHVNNVP